MLKLSTSSRITENGQDLSPYNNYSISVNNLRSKQHSGHDAQYNISSAKVRGHGSVHSLGTDEDPFAGSSQTNLADTHGSKVASFEMESIRAGGIS